MRKTVLSMLLVLCIMGSCLVVTPVYSQASTAPHTIHGFITDVEGVPVFKALVYVNNTNTTEFLSEFTDITGAYSIDISAFPSGYQPPPTPDNLTVTAVYGGYVATATIQVNSSPTQMVSLTLGITTHVIKGTVLKPDMTAARQFSVNVTNTMTSETHFVVTNNSGQYWIDLVGYQNGYTVGDGLLVAVDFDGFEGSTGLTVTNSSTQTVDLSLNDVREPEFTQLSAPVTASINDALDITIRVTDNLAVQDVFLHYWDIHGTGNMVAMSEYAPNRYEYTIPAQGGLGSVDYYIRATDGVNQATYPAGAPPGNTISIIDEEAPVITHVPEASVEAGDALEVVAVVIDDLASELSRVSLNYSNAGAAFYNEVVMTPTGEPDEYGATIPAQTQLGTVRYNITAIDKSGNWQTEPQGTWNVSVVDTTAPVLNHVPVNSANLGDVINITASVMDLIGIHSVKLNYTDVSGVNSNVSMSKGLGYNWHYDIPGQAAIGTVGYFIWANDTEGNVRRTVRQDVQINDVGTPVITHAPVETVEVFNSTNISATITDDGIVTSATLFYMQVGNPTYESIAMTHVTPGDEWTAEIPSQEELGVMRYYINATDGTNNITHPAMKPCHNLTVMDTTCPNLNHSVLPTSTVMGVGIPLEVNVTDNYMLDAVMAYYRRTVNSTWLALDMSSSNADSRGNGTYQAIIPPQAAPGNVTYYFFVNDTEGNNATLPQTLPKVNPFFVEITDGGLPEVHYTPPDEIGVNQTLAITVNVTDDHMVTEVEVHYNGTEDTGFTSIVLYKSEGSNYTGEIPAQNLGGILQLYFTASDGVNVNQTDSYEVDVVNTPPSIEHEAISDALIGKSVNILATVRDDLHVDGVEMLWRVKGQEPYTTAAMARSLQEVYSTAIGPFDEALTIEYHIEARDREANSTLPETGEYEIDIGDPTPPVITHTALTNLTTSSLPIITCEVTDDVNVAYVLVYFTNASSEAENSQELLPVSGTDDQYAVVLGKQPKGEFAYHLEASDGVNTVRMPSTGEYTVEVTVPPGDSWGTILLIVLVVLLIIAALVIYQYRRKTING